MWKTSLHLWSPAPVNKDVPAGGVILISVVYVRSRQQHVPLLRLCHISGELHSCILYFCHLSLPLFFSELKAFIKSLSLISDARDLVANDRWALPSNTQGMVTAGGAALPLQIQTSASEDVCSWLMVFPLVAAYQCFWGLCSYLISTLF